MGLATEVPELELYIKSTVKVMVRGTPPYAQGEQRISWGPYFVGWSDEASVLAFFLNFEAAWDALPPEDRTKTEVIAYVEALLHRVDC